ncbi:uncharacterized protein LOC129944326 [Eupeodes corollae]|uniref:uncharacterized protein LOC129944326 n=1 Tax=Eupeodes corollae TaxID=290404 RepID=UPI0024928C59|nr:uncharacterized protein LOC129944326 [Eupeodes corollae]
MLQNKILSKITSLLLLLVILCTSVVVGIFDPHYTEKTKSYRLDPYIARELQRTHHHHNHQHQHQNQNQHHEVIPSYRSQSNPRLSSSFGRYQESSSSISSSSRDTIEQQERHANHDRKDYANNLDDYYGGCPSGYTGLLPYPYDCRRFVNCWKGRAYIQTCGPGTVFNGDTLECDNPNKVVCKGLNAKSYENSQSTNNRLGRLERHDEAEDMEVSCPQGHTGLLPHPNDCSKFLNCASGIMHIQTCGPQTMFNPRMKVCDFATKVDCTGRGGAARGGDDSSLNSSPSQSPTSWSGNRGGKNFEITTTQNQPTQPQRKGWQHNHNHHHDHGHNHNHHQHGFHHHDYPSGPSSAGSLMYHNHNCTHRSHQNHYPQHVSPPPQQPTVSTPLIYRNRWTSMNRTRPAAPTTKTSTVPVRSWTPTPNPQPSGWRPILQQPIPSKPTWFNREGSGTTTPPSNYPNSYFGSTPIPGTDTTIYYAQPVDDNQPSEEVFTNVVGADISEITLPVNRRNFIRGVFTPTADRSIPSDPSLDAINIPNINLMPPYPTITSDDRQFQIPDEDLPHPFQPNFQDPPSRPDFNAQGRNPPVDSRDAVFLNSGSYQPPQSNRRPDSYPQGGDGSMDAINIPNQNLMPPHVSPPSSDDRQSEIPEQFPDLQPPPLPQPPASRPSQNHPRTFPNENPIYDINIRNNLPVPQTTTPKWEEPYPDYSSVYPSFTLPNSRPSSKPVSRDSVAQSPPSSVTPSWLRPEPPLPSYSPNPADSVIISPTSSSRDNPWIRIDESNLFGGMLPPLPPDSEPPSSFNPFSSTQPPSIQSTTPPPLKTNVRVFQVFPPPEVRNATTKIHPNPFYSPSYSGVAHSRNTSWPSIKTYPPSRSTTPSPRSWTTTPFPKFWPTTPQTPEDNFKPDIVFSHDGGVVIASHHMSPTTTQRHGLSPPSYNREYYQPTTPMSVHRAAPLETDTNDEQTGQMPISEAIKLLLRPYINRSGTVTDDMVSKAESHIMNLSQSLDPTSTSTTTIRSSVAPDGLRKDVEIVFAGEQNSLSPSYAPPPPLPSSSVQHPPPSKYHQSERHNRHFHQMHPNMPNPFGNELGASGVGEDDDRPTAAASGVVRSTTPFLEETSPEAVGNVKETDLCEFDCGNGQCVKTFETCDGINNCENKKDEEQCGHLGYEIRLSNEGYGRVEVKILGQWGYVCDDKFGIQDANVVCRELGFPLGASEVHGNSYYPPADGGEVSFIMDEVDCAGNETSLKDCRFMGWGVSDCGPDEVAGVQCKTPVMTCPNDYWLCSTSKECIPPAFVCDNVPDCTDKSDESTAICNSTVEFRLKGGRSKQEGRLEVLYRGVWGTVCDDDFGQTEAQVACNSLGFYGPAAIVKNAFGPGTGPIWLDQLSCYGNETSLDTCNHWSWGEHNCNHTEDVSLKCTPGSAPPSKNTKTKGPSNSEEDVQTAASDDIGMDLYPMERSSKSTNSRKVCGHFNANLTDEFPRELERVVKGNIAKRGHHPWQATIRTKGRGGISSHWCGAVLISKKHLLTAAHCLVGYPKGAYFIRLGDHYANIAESSEIDSYIENWYIHEKFREGTHMNNDIAVIVMKNPVRFNDYIQPICLPQEGTEYKEGRRCTISGWGSIQSGVSTPSNNLRVAEIPVISDEVCKLPHVYGNSVTEGMFCAGFLEEGVDACEGDSGGPFVCSDSDAETLYGIISWGQQCGHANKPGVYVKIEKYLNWIYEKIRFSMQPTD